MVPITIKVQNSAFATIHFNMTLGGDFSIGEDSAGTYHADFSHTLRWGGIDSVTDDDTGLPVTDWTLTADSVQTTTTRCLYPNRWRCRSSRWRAFGGCCVADRADKIGPVRLSTR